MSDIRKFFSPVNQKKPPVSPKKSALSSERKETGSPKALPKRSKKLEVPSEPDVLTLDLEESDNECPIPKSLKADAKKQKKGAKNSRKVVLDSSEEEFFEESIVSKAEKKDVLKKRSRRLVVDSESEEESKSSKKKGSKTPSPVKKTPKKVSEDVSPIKKRSRRLVVDSESEEERKSPKKKGSKTPSPVKKPPKKKARIVETSEDEPSPKKRTVKESSPEVMEIDDESDHEKQKRSKKRRSKASPKMEDEESEAESKRKRGRRRTPPNQQKLDAVLSKKIPSNKQLPKNLEKPKEQLKRVDPLAFFSPGTALGSKSSPKKTLSEKKKKSVIEVEETADDDFIVVQVEPKKSKNSRKPLGEITKTPSPKKSSSNTPEKPKKQKEQINPKKQKDEVVHYQTFNTVCVKMEASPLVVQKKAELPWVDKYKPQDLKSLAGQSTDKAPAKKLLQWLKEWAKNNLGINGLMKKCKPNPFAAQHDGTAFKAALLSGPPGIGKTSAAVICCKELGLKYVEMNASDARNKKLLSEKTAELLGSRQMDEFLTGEIPNNKLNEITHVLIMDEVDGMSGNQDRGGISEVIQLIKDSKIPIICICNDRMHPKIRSLANHCFDLRFQRPRIEQIKARLMTIIAREKLKINNDVLNDLMEASNHDIRQCIYSLQLIAAGASGVVEKKDISVNIFEAARKILSNDTNLGTKQEMFFSDYSIMPLFVQENYPNVRGDNMSSQSHLRALRQAATCISDADILDKQVRSQGSWNLLPEYGLMSCAIPSMYLDGHMTDQIAFPSWLGKNSSANKRQRMMRQLATHAHLKVTGNCHAMVTDYVPLLRDKMTRPLIEKDVDGIREVIDVYNYYNLVKDDAEAISELGVWPGMKDPKESVSTKAKSALTRNLNKESRLLPYSVVTVAKGKKKAISVEEELDEEGHVVEKVVGGNSEDEAEEVEDVPEIKIKTDKQDSKKGRGGATRGRGRGRGAKN